MESRVPYFLPTKEEAKEIKAGNKGLIDRFYLLNLPQIRACARAFCYRRKRNKLPLRYDFEDYVQEAYLHFSDFCFENIGYFSGSLYRYFSAYNWGGLHKYKQLKYGRYSVNEEEYLLDVVMPSGDETFGDFIPSNDLVMLSPSFSISENLYSYLSSFLGKEQNKVFYCLFWTGLTYREIADLLNRKERIVASYRWKIFKKFREHQDEIRKYLDEIGYADRNGIPA